MRNILEYPITIEEKIAALEAAIAQALDTEAIGDITPVALSELLEEQKAKLSEQTRGS